MELSNIPASAFPRPHSKAHNSKLCIVCKIGNKQNPSWFCRQECEDVFVKEYVKKIIPAKQKTLEKARNDFHKAVQIMIGAAKEITKQTDIINANK